MSIPFNSSDGLEPGEDLLAQHIARRGPKFGQHTMPVMLENKTIDRVSSKQVQRRIQPQKGSPSSQDSSLTCLTSG